MIVADKRYVDQKAIMIPSPENFRTAVNDSLNFTYASCAAWVNWEALQEECSDVGKMYDDNLSGYHDVNKISDDIYIISETLGKKTYYVPYVIGKSNKRNTDVCYESYDEAIIAAMATKYLKNSHEVCSMTNVIAKLIDKTTEE